MNYLYYPGCSLKSSGRPYEESIRAVFKALDLGLTEIEDWNCCGATAYMAVNELKAYALASRNLALAEKQGTAADPKAKPEVVAPCAACYLVLTKAQHYLAAADENAQKIREALKAGNQKYKGKVKVRHPLDIFVNQVGLETIQSHVRRPLEGMRVACYYGCQIVRPYATFDDQIHPTTMDRLVETLGGEPVDWPLKTRCCGGSLTGTIEEVGLRLSYILLREAKKRGADVLITACPLCQFNLECYQDRMSKMYEEPVELPVAFFTQLMGMAFGLPDEELGLHRLFVPLRPAAAAQEGGQHVHA